MQRRTTVDDVEAVLVCNALLFTVTFVKTRLLKKSAFFGLLSRVSFHLEELFVEVVRLVSCMLPSLLIPLCRSWIIRW